MSEQSHLGRRATSSTLDRHQPPPGSRPGTLALPADSPPPKIAVIAYSPTHHEQRSLSDIDGFEALRAELPTDCSIWVDVQGLGDEATLRAIAKCFGIHPLGLEDAVNIPQRPKQEVYDGEQLIVARAPRMEDGSLRIPQVAIFIGDGHVVTFQERYLGFFELVRARLKEGIGPIRAAGVGYLAYVLVDTLVDHFYPVVDRIAQEVDELEDEVFTRPRSDMLERLHGIRRSLTSLRRVSAPQREMLRDLVHHPSPMLGDQYQGYWRDTYDHAAQLLDIIDATRDVGRSLVDAHLSALSHRQNEIMKVLTLMASIFIPLTFVAGIYGMNFEYMPELKSDRGYFVVLALMVLIGVAMVGYFRRRGWLGGD